MSDLLDNEALEASEEAIKQTTTLVSTLWDKFINYLPTLLIAVFVFLLGLLIARIIGKIVNHALGGKKLDRAASSFGKSLVQILLYVLLAVICLSILGVPMASIITVIGTAGVTVGLALQNSLSNLAGGFVILFAKPFGVGDFIQVGDAEGHVESVTILYTKLISRDNRSIYLPNSIVSSGKLINLSQNGKLRVSTSVTVSYQANIGDARNALLSAIAASGIDCKNPAAAVTVNELGDNGVTLAMHVWVKQEDYVIAPGRLLEQAKTALEAAGIEIPYPQITVHPAEPPKEKADRIV